ncbi:MAG: hypothetical protein V4684_03280 [Pseudomonadota bacterium]
MIPYALDPTLHAAPPQLCSLDDGYSPVLSMATHPSEPDVGPPGVEPDQQPNPTQLPVEPEFGIALPPAEPEDPGVTAPTV